MSAIAEPNNAPRAITDLPANHVIIFGEMHGVREIPEFIANQVTTLLRTGYTVRLGLELSSEDTEALNAAMEIEDEKARHLALLELEQWAQGTDSRNGESMAAMLGKLGRLNTSYPGRLIVFAFDIPWGTSKTTNQRDMHMARIVGEHREQAGNDEYVLALVGNAHAFLAKGAPWDGEYESMARQLKAAGHPVTSLRNSQSGGTAWLCTPECGPQPLAEFDPRAVGIYLQPYEMDWADETVYDGVFFYGHGSLSRPLPVVYQAEARGNGESGQKYPVGVRRHS